MKKLALGWKPDLPDQRDLRFSAPLSAAAAADLPIAVDLTAMMPPVWDQGYLGSCTAQAVGAVLQYQQRRQLDADFVPSRLFVYYNSRLIEGSVGYDAGATLRDTMKAVARYGAGPEDQWPYDIAKFRNLPRKSVYNGARKHQLLLYRRVDRGTVAMRSLLASGTPFVFGFAVYDSFMSEDVDATGVVPMPGPREYMLGGHAVVVVGYDDEESIFLCRNSWGEEWGNAGHFRMPYAYLLDDFLSDDFWTVSLVE